VKPEKRKRYNFQVQSNNELNLKNASQANEKGKHLGTKKISSFTTTIIKLVDNSVRS